MKNMKSILTLILLIFNLGLTGQIVENDLQAYYRFNESGIIDESVNSITGIGYDLVDAIGLEQTMNSAYEFDGLSSYIDAGIDNRNVTDRVTISVWIKTTSNENQVICSKYDWTEDKGYFIRMVDGKASIGGRNNGGEFIEIFGSENINDGQWHNVIGLLDQNSWTIYVDCQKQDEIISSSNNPNIINSVSLTIGRLSIPVTNGSEEYRHFDGVIDELRIYNRKLGELEVDSLCQQSFVTGIEEIEKQTEVISIYPNPTKDNVNCYWSFNSEKSTYKFYDLTGILLKEGQLKKEISLNDLKKGIYLMVITNDEIGIFQTKKVIKN